jgi:hypothetical protein
MAGEQGFNAATKVAALDTKVSALDRDVRQINDRITGLETKFDNVATSLSHEFRDGLSLLTKQVSDRGSTKWSVIFAGLGVGLTVIGMIGTLVWYPVSTGLAEAKANIRRIEDRDYAEKQKQIDLLRSENRYLRHKSQTPDDQ